MKTLTRESFSSLRETAIVLDEGYQRSVKGGCTSDDHGVGYTDSGGNYHWTRTSECNSNCWSSGSSGSYGSSSGYNGSSGYSSSGYVGSSGYGTGSGGGSGSGSGGPSAGYGSSSNPVSWDDYYRLLDAGMWYGGYIENGTYAYPDVTITTSYYGSSSYGSSSYDYGSSYYGLGSSSGSYSSSNYFGYNSSTGYSVGSSSGSYGGGGYGGSTSNNSNNEVNNPENPIDENDPRFIYLAGVVQNLEELAGLTDTVIIIDENLERANAVCREDGTIAVSPSWFNLSDERQISTIYHEINHRDNPLPFERNAKDGILNFVTDQKIEYSQRELDKIRQECRELAEIQSGDTDELEKKYWNYEMNKNYTYWPSNYLLSEVNAYQAELDGEKMGWWTYSDEDRAYLQNALDDFKDSYNRALKYEAENNYNPDGSKK